MSTLDIILALFLFYFAFKGFTNGFIISIATLAGLILGFYAASHFSEFTANWLQHDMGLKSGNIKLIAYIAIVRLAYRTRNKSHIPESFVI